MTVATRAVRRWVRRELHLADHVVTEWRCYVLPLCLGSVGLLYWLSPLDLIRDKRLLVGHADEMGILLAGLLAARIAVQRAWSRRAADERQWRAPKLRDGDRSAASLINDGMIVLNPGKVRPEERARTIIVSGVARGGTSMAAQIVRRAGIPLGDTADDVVAEDREFVTALSCMHLAPLRRLIAHRNGQHRVWGLKVTNIFACLAPWDIGLFRNPYLVLVIRDPVAIAQRNVISMFGAPRVRMAEAFADTERLGRFVQRVAAPVLLVSYEKALAKPDLVVRAICDFCGVDPVDGRRPDATAVQPENEAYLLDTALAELPPPPQRIRHRIAGAILAGYRGRKGSSLRRC